MNKFLYLAIFFLGSSALLSQTTLVSWDFSGSANTPTSGLPINATRTITNNATGSNTYPTGSSGSCPAPYVLSTNWNSGNGTKYWQFSFASTGYQSITVSFDARSSGTGPRDFKLQMSTTAPGTSGYTDVPGATYAVANTACDPYGSFSLPVEADDKSDVYIRLIMTSNTSQNGGTVATGGTNGLDNINVVAAAAAPIELLNFDIEAANEGNLLLFSTASERNNAYFVIERAADGNRYRELARIKGAGQSYVRKDYRYLDAHPQKGLNYYRLKQVDFDGTFVYSQVISAKNGTENGLQLAPVPALDDLRVSFAEPLPEGTAYEVSDLFGRMIKNGIFASESNLYYLNLADLPQGTYIFRVVQGPEMLSQAFIKQ